MRAHASHPTIGATTVDRPSCSSHVDDVVADPSGKQPGKDLLFVDGDVQPSFVVIAKRIGDRKRDLHPLYRARIAHSPLEIDETGYMVTQEEMATGLTHTTYCDHRKNLFTLAPTMAPVDYDLARPGFLEHPEAAFRYYAERGVTAIPPVSISTAK